MSKPKPEQLSEEMETEAEAQAQTGIYCVDTGAADAYVITPDPVISAYAAGQAFEFNASAANTGASTLNVCSLGIKAIKKNKDQALAANDIKAGQIVRVVYDGTNFQMESQLGNVSSVTLSDSTPLVESSTGLPGVSSSVSRCDHVHPVYPINSGDGIVVTDSEDTNIPTTMLYFNGTSGSSTITDSVGSLTFTSTALLSDVQKKFGVTSLRTNGSDQYATGDDSAPDVLDFRTGNFTFSFWFYPLDSVGNGSFKVITGIGDTVTNYQGFVIYQSNNKILLQFMRVGGATWEGGATGIFSDHNVNLTAWNHLEMVRDGNNIYLFLNGHLNILVSSFTYDISMGDSWKLTFGRHPLDTSKDSAYNFNGYIDEWVGYKGIALHTADFIVPAKQIDVITGLKVSAFTYFEDSGSANTYVITPDPLISAYAAGQIYQFKALNANSGASTLNVNGLGAKAIKKFYNIDVVTGDIKASQIISVQYDGTNFQMISPVSGPSVPGGSSTQIQYNDGAILAGSANLVWDKTYNRLGIGIGAPIGTLDIRTGASTGVLIGNWGAVSPSDVADRTLLLGPRPSSASYANFGLQIDSTHKGGFTLTTTGMMISTYNAGWVDNVIYWLNDGSTVLGGTSAISGCKLSVTGGIGCKVSASYPTAYLHSGSSSQKGAYVQFANTAGNRWSSIGTAVPDTGTTGDDLIFATYNGSSWVEYLRLTNAGLLRTPNGERTIITDMSDSASQSGYIVSLGTADSIKWLKFNIRNQSTGDTNQGFWFSQNYGANSATESYFLKLYGTSTQYAMFNSLVGIMSSLDSGYAFQISNSSSYKAKAYAWDTYSDQRIKSDIQDLKSGLNIILELKPKKYYQHDSELYTDNEFSELDDIANGKHKISSKKKATIGLIAQDVYKIIPEAVNCPIDESSELWSMDYTKIIPVIVKAIQELSQKFDEIKNK